MNITKLAAGVALAVVASTTIISCDDTTDNIGSALVQTDSKVEIVNDFTLTGNSVENNRIQSRTITQLIGSLQAEGYGSLESDFVTQFMPVAQIDTLLRTVEDIDSVKLLLLFSKGSYVGDSIVPMGMKVYQLNRQLEAPIFSDFNPADYYDPSAPLGSKIYGASNLNYNDSLSTDSYNAVYVDLPRSLGVDLYNLYKTNPEAYLSPTAFAKYFPGIYVKNSYGNGRVTALGSTAIETFFHYTTQTDEGNDTIINTSGVFYKATPEIISNNNIRYNVADNLSQRIANGEQLIVAPAGYDVEITFPAKDVISYYKANKSKLSVINSLTMTIPVERITNNYGIEPPQYLLMVLKNKKQEFFETSSTTNSTTSFYAEYNSSAGCYIFSSLRQYLLNCIENEATLTADDFTFTLTPIEIEFETQTSYYTTITSVKSIVPYASTPTMARLLLDDATISFTFSNQQ